MVKDFNRKLILEDGQEYYGYAFGSTTDKVCELVFNTSMVGYQEIISDPSYTYQAVVMTYPLIGNYGMADDDYETAVPSIGALIVREYNDEPSNFRSSASLSEIMKKFDISGIQGIDTRKLTRSIRNYGSRKALITDASTSIESGLSILDSKDIPHDAVSSVSCKTIWVSPSPTPKFNVVAIDCGMKLNIVRSLNSLGCNVTVVPWDTAPSCIEGLSPDGIFISNGPGDPVDVKPVIDTIKSLKGRYPMFGICLGHQLISLAYGAKTYKLKFGHRGGNHPVKNLETKKIEITSQNHSYAVDLKSLENTALIPTHINLLDMTVEGVKCDKDIIFSVQYHPESAPGPQDSAYLFRRFTDMMEEVKSHA
jgi:carbamoyl-phosphate synthase small subunit